jgi:phosphoribosyl-ATP pyrophosphohydrolase/phosphoribosyl-AMP cyclohydrolase
MLAYVNQESYDFMADKGETCFWSRSRRQLWHKGATSGNVQKIKHICFDCDNDTLLIQVEQTGEGACHTGSYSCFGEEPGEFYALNNLLAVTAEREANPRPSSYTNYLLKEGTDKICKKIGEEAAEIIIAAKNSDNDNLTGEIADMVYHISVLMHTRGVSWRDITNELNKRRKMKGNT